MPTLQTSTAASELTFMDLDDLEDLASRIERVQDLRREEWHRHQNLDGSIGGWVENTAAVAATAFIGRDALVLDWAQVGEGAEVRDVARVSGRSVILGIVSEQAEVIGGVQIGKRCTLKGTVLLCGNGWLNSGTYSKGTITVATPRGGRPLITQLSL